MNDDKFNKQFDLEPSEYRPIDAPEPFWGINAKDTAILFLVAMVADVVMTRLVYGSFPYWVRPFLE